MKQGFGFKDVFTAQVEPLGVKASDPAPLPVSGLPVEIPPSPRDLVLIQKAQAKADVPPLVFDSAAAMPKPPRELLLIHKAQPKVEPAHPVLLAEIKDDLEEVTDCGSMTIAQHLEQGRITAERRQCNANARTQRLADKRMYHWSCLMQAVKLICGPELTEKCMEPEPPMDFGFDTERVVMTFRPFNRSTFACTFGCQLRKMENEARDYESPWSLLRGPGHKPFVVHQDWRPAQDGIKPFVDERVFTVSEAVHLCYLQGGGWDDAQGRYLKMRERDAKEFSDVPF